MQSKNPVFARSDTFNQRNAYRNPTYAGNGPHIGYAQTAPGYTDPSTWRTGGSEPRTSLDTGRITIDSVVQKTAITLGVLVVAAAATWILTGDLVTEEDRAGLMVWPWAARSSASRWPWSTASSE